MVNSSCTKQLHRKRRLRLSAEEFLQPRDFEGSKHPFAQSRKNANGEYSQQATVFASGGKPEDAVRIVMEATWSKPDNGAGQFSLENLLLTQANPEDAGAGYPTALSSNPATAEAYCHQANALVLMGKCEEAVACCQKALAIDPKNLHACNTMGMAYHALGKLPDAAASYERALAINPGLPEAHNNLGVLHAFLNQLDEAVAHCSEALRLKPDYGEAYFNLGHVFIRRKDWDEAVLVLQQAVGLRPEHAQAIYFLGYAYRQQGKPQKAEHCLQQVTRLKPDNVAAHLTLGLCQLVRGNFAAGWQEYEWRLQRTDVRLSHFQQPTWDGTGLAGKTILLHAEQGLGDTIQFARYAPLVKQYGGTVILACQSSLVPLLTSCPGIDRLVPADSELPAFDVHAPLLSLPRILKTSLATIPADAPYLSASRELQCHWQAELDRYPGIKVGIAWQGNPDYPLDWQRSIPLVQFAPLSRVEGACLISLQKGPGTEQLSQIGELFPVLDLGSRLDEKSGAFMDTAAVMKNLDLVVTSDTATAHLAGALCVPVWVALSAVADWRWLLQREDSPWYPSMRLFRQPEPGDWEGVFERMAQELAKWRETCRRQRSVRVEISPGELIDKITILEIKAEAITNAGKLRNIRAELVSLQGVREGKIQPSRGIDLLTANLKAINRLLWHVEDEIRRCEKLKDFGPRFLELARSVYQQNDRRSAIKREINELLGSAIREEKSYAN